MSTPAVNPYAHPSTPLPPLSPAEEKQWSILTHVLSIFFGIVAAAVFFFLFRSRGPFVRAHTTTEWNLQLTVTALSAVFFLVSVVSMVASVGMSVGTQTSGPPAGLALFFVGYFGVIAVRIVASILGIVASVAANRGRYYRYSIAIPFAKV